jgi:SAM-dependent methyltransferase
VKQRSPAFPRNRDPILAVLRATLPARGLVWEVGSGPGEHAACFAAALPGLSWQPTERLPSALPAIEAWRADGPPNLLPPVALDLAAASPVRPPGEPDALVAINVLHASPWPATLGLLALASAALRPGGLLLAYGAWSEGGAAEPSNVAFDADLKARDPRFGLRDVREVSAAAAAVGLNWIATHFVPANNRVLVWRRS